MLNNPKDDGFVLRLFQSMDNAEKERISVLIGLAEDVSAWYSPTAFWPEFNKIDAPRLLCVPDVVLSDFPVGFSLACGERMLSNFEAVRESIRTGEHFVTYSKAVKLNTLVDRYGICEGKVSVVNHAPNDLSCWLPETDSNLFCEKTRISSEDLFNSALEKSSLTSYTSGFKNSSVQFLFYASQFRPNKNIFSLLRAYAYLLKKKFICHKLILTGNTASFPEVAGFILKNRLENDVLCLHGLSIKELAACYKLADLAVNPSLSEGGCPFTFTEALSVDTPVVMARIPVTEEVLTEPDLQEITFFDPYDWKDMAGRIEWALDNREALLERQRTAYRQLSKRTWSDVVNEHIDILDRIAMEASEAEGSSTLSDGKARPNVRLIDSAGDRLAS